MPFQFGKGSRTALEGAARGQSAARPSTEGAKRSTERVRGMNLTRYVKAAIGGHYEGDYFNFAIDPSLSPTSPATIRRQRTVVQLMNTEFTDHLRPNGHKNQIDTSGLAVASADDDDDDGWIASEGRRSSEKLMAPNSRLDLQLDCPTQWH